MAASRVDYVLQDPDTLRWLDQRIHRRVLPEILKAFQYRVTKRERFHIARYGGARGGFQHGHRDNPTPELAHRRFALSLNLNTEEYEGGALRFPEYGGQRYRAETGSASSSQARARGARGCLRPPLRAAVAFLWSGCQRTDAKFRCQRTEVSARR